MSISMAPDAPSLALAPGVWPQIYRDVLPGDSEVARRDALARGLDAFVELGVAGVAMHGFSSELPARLPALAAMARERGLPCLAAFGMDSRDPSGKGRRIGVTASMPECAGVVLDAEGAWEDEATDRANAREFGEAFRTAAPTALAIDQPWFAARSHWTRFPWEEFARVVQFRAPQVYVNNFRGRYGRARYRRVWSWYRRDWTALEARLSPQGLLRPRIVTIQGYAWELSDLVDCLLQNPTVLLWCEPFPDAVAVLGLRVVTALRAYGFVGPDAVRAFQSAARIAVDGLVGPRTLANLGLP